MKYKKYKMLSINSDLEFPAATRCRGLSSAWSTASGRTWFGSVWPIPDHSFAFFGSSYSIGMRETSGLIQMNQKIQSLFEYLMSFHHGDSIVPYDISNILLILVLSIAESCQHISRVRSFSVRSRQQPLSVSLFKGN